MCAQFEQLVSSCYHADKKLPHTLLTDVSESAQSSPVQSYTVAEMTAAESRSLFNGIKDEALSKYTGSKCSLALNK